MSRMRNDEEVIGEWIKEGEAFVFYREPGERAVSYTHLTLPTKA